MRAVRAKQEARQFRPARADEASEAKDLAREHVQALSSALSGVAVLASEVAEGGELYPVDARELARRLGKDAQKQSLTLCAILERTH